MKINKPEENKKPKKYSQGIYDAYARARDIRFVSRDDEQENNQEESIIAWEDY